MKDGLFQELILGDDVLELLLSVHSLLFLEVESADLVSKSLVLHLDLCELLLSHLLPLIFQLVSMLLIRCIQLLNSLLERLVQLLLIILLSSSHL